MPGVRTHYLRGNESEWSPSNVVFVDTETRTVTGSMAQVLQMRLWVGGSVDRRGAGPTAMRVRTDYGPDRHSFAKWVDAQTVGHQTTWLYAHNLGFDLTTSRLIDHLHRLGWTMGRWDFAGRNVTGSMRKRSKRIRLADSTSILPHPLAHIGNTLGRHKLPMPTPEASEEDWLEYCTQDVLILADAILTLMDWWDTEKLGHWTASGPGLGWNAMRHKGPPRMFLINHDHGSAEDDRKAVRGGRRDVTRVGVIPGGPFALVDFSNAYLTVAATRPLPKGRVKAFASEAELPAWYDPRWHGLMAECEVEVTEPFYPLRTERGVFYPTGRFRTVLCQPEIDHAREAGHLRHIGPGWIHDMGWSLSGWGEWCLALLDADNDVTPPVVRAMVKQWGRSVIGKFATRQSRTTDLGPALWPSWHLTPGTTGANHARAADVHIAGRHWLYQFDQEGENSYPAVLAWVESYTRVALGKMLAALGEGLWVCCDTDGAVLDLTRARSWLTEHQHRFGPIRGPLAAAEGVCEVLRQVTGPLVPRVKLMSETLTVIGPQHYQGETFERAAGRPGKAETGADGKLEFWTWPKVAWQMTQGSPEGFVRTQVQWTHPSQLAHRWVLLNETTVPVRAQIGDDGTSRLSPWEAMAESMGEIDLHHNQAPALRGLY